MGKYTGLCCSAAGALLEPLTFCGVKVWMSVLSSQCRGCGAACPASLTTLLPLSLSSRVEVKRPKY